MPCGQDPRCSHNAGGQMTTTADKRLPLWVRERNLSAAKAVACLAVSIALFVASRSTSLDFIGWIAVIGFFYYPHPLFQALDAQSIVKRMRRNEQNADRWSATFTGFIISRSEYAFHLLWGALTLSAMLICGIVARVLG